MLAVLGDDRVSRFPVNSFQGKHPQIKDIGSAFRIDAGGADYDDVIFEKDDDGITAEFLHKFRGLCPENLDDVVLTGVFDVGRVDKRRSGQRREDEEEEQGEQKNGDCKEFQDFQGGLLR